jgi:CBS domain-containing protein
VEEAMTAAPDVLCLSPDTPLREGLRVMLARGVHAAPVVDDQVRAIRLRKGPPDLIRQGGVIGLLSQTDLLSLAAGDSASADLARLQYVAGEPRDAPPLTLRGAVRAALPRGAPLAAVPPAAPLPEAAALMLARGLHTLPVVDVPGDSAEVAEHAADAESPPRLLGVVSRTDILRAVLAAADREQDEDAFL